MFYETHRNMNIDCFLLIKCKYQPFLLLGVFEYEHQRPPAHVLPLLPLPALPLPPQGERRARPPRPRPLPKGRGTPLPLPPKFARLPAPAFGVSGPFKEI